MNARTAYGKSAAVVSAIAVLGGLLVTFGWLHLQSSIQRDEGHVRVRGIEGEVTVSFDSMAIPHIRAASEHDLFFAQGWVFASQRLWQLELFRRTAQGRLAELFGDAALDADRFLRTLDLWGLARQSLEAASPEERAVLEAYAAGVNARIAAWRGSLPPEFRLLGIRPEPWTPVATMAVSRLMALDLATWRNELGRFRAESLVSEEMFEELVPAYPDWGPTIGTDSVDVPAALRAGESGESASSRRRMGSEDRTAAAGSPAAPEGARFLPESSRADRNPLELVAGFSARSGSNAWAIAASRTAGGFPILASDMHLELRAPSIWYVVSLYASSTGYQVAGLTLPGVPGVVAGYNREVAWTYTNGMVDDMDFVVETVSPDRSAYRLRSEWTPFETRAETIQVRGRAEPVVHTVRRTARGPVITDALAPIGATLSLLWTAARPASEIGGLLAMGRALDADSLDAAIRRFSLHQQNVTYATRSGAIGFRLSGVAPLRRADLQVTPVELPDEGAGWPGFWAAESLPADRDPEAGFVVSANNLQAPGLDGVLSVDYPVPFRARRITDRLASHSVWDRESVTALQRDVYSLLGERVLPEAMAAARRIGTDSALALLRGWDFEVRADSRAAALFYAWLYRLRGLVAADEYRNAPSWAFYPTGTLLQLVERGGGSRWVDDVTTPEEETFETLSDRALRDAVRLTAYRTWGELHSEIHRHPLGYSPWLDRIFGFNVGPYPAPGGPNTVRPDDYRRWNRLDSTSWTPPYSSGYGPSERFVVELRPEGSIGFFLIPTGQSANPLSRHYRDQAARWSTSRLIPVRLDEALGRDQAVRRLVLEPDPGR